MPSQDSPADAIRRLAAELTTKAVAVDDVELGGIAIALNMCANNTDHLAWNTAALAFATQFRLPLTNKVGGYAEITIQRGDGDYRHLWAVTDGAFTGLRAWTETDGWRYISDIGRKAAYRHTLREAFALGRQVVEIESACLEVEINAIRAQDN